MVPSFAPQLEPEVPLVVGIGGGTGGVEALSEVLAFDFDGPALVVVLKTRRVGEAALLQALQRTARLETCSAVTGTQHLPNRVYVVPAGKLATVEAGTLLLEEVHGTQCSTNPIDHLFGSLARSHGRRAIAMLLSGRGQDGCRGLTAVQRAGGKILVQSPQSALIRSMPHHAASTADFVLNPFQLGLQLLKLLTTPATQRQLGR